MKMIDVEKLKTGDFVLAFDSGLCELSPMEWFKCKVNKIEKHTVTLEYLEGDLKGFVFYEILGNLKNPGCYKQAG
ncbi:hypothetical protein ES705_16506 [subsurface metagenome]